MEYGALDLQNIIDPAIAPAIELGLQELLIRLGASLLFGFILSLVGRKFTPKSSQGGITVLVGLLTFIGASLVILIGGSIVLTLGLVGGLSAVRFRAAIKDPVDIACIFIALIIGIGTGAGLLMYAAVITIIYCLAFIWYSTLIKRKAILLVRMEIYEDKFDVVTSIVFSYKDVIIHKKQESPPKNEIEVVYVEFEISDSLKNRKLLNNLSTAEGVVSFNFSEQLKLGQY